MIGIVDRPPRSGTIELPSDREHHLQSARPRTALNQGALRSVGGEPRAR